MVVLGHPIYWRKDAPTCRQTAVHEAVEVACCRRRLQVESTSSLPLSLTRFTSFFFFCLHIIPRFDSICFIFSDTVNIIIYYILYIKSLIFSCSCIFSIFFFFWNLFRLSSTYKHKEKTRSYTFAQFSCTLFLNISILDWMIKMLVQCQKIKIKPRCIISVYVEYKSNGIHLFIINGHRYCHSANRTAVCSTL